MAAPIPIYKPHIPDAAPAGPALVHGGVPAAGGRLPPGKIELGDDDELIHAVSEHLKKGNGGKFPDGVTMHAKYERDDKNAIKVETYKDPQSHPNDPPFITFWRTFTVKDKDGNEIAQFRKRIYTNIPTPDKSEGSGAFQRALEVASMACSAYSKMCNDAILVKGGGASNYNLDAGKVDTLQKQAFVKMGKSYEEISIHGRKLKEIDVSIGGVNTSKLNLEWTNLKGTSMKTRLKHFTVTSYTKEVLADRIDQFDQTMKKSGHFNQSYITDAGLAHELKQAQDGSGGDLIKAGRKLWQKYNEKAKAGGADSKAKAETLLEAFAQCGRDIQQTLQDARTYKKREDMGFWQRRGTERRILSLENRLNNLKSTFPAVHEQMYGAKGVPDNTPLSAKPAKSLQFSLFKKEAEREGIHKDFHDDFALQKVFIASAEREVTSQDAKIKGLKDDLKKMQEQHDGPPKAVGEVRVALEKQMSALGAVIKAESDLSEALKLKMKGQESFLDVIRQNSNANAKVNDAPDALAFRQAGEASLRDAKAKADQAQIALQAARAKFKEGQDAVAKASKEAKTEAYQKEAKDKGIDESLVGEYVMKKIALDERNGERDARKADLAVMRSERAALKAELDSPHTNARLKPALQARHESLNAQIQEEKKLSNVDKLKCEAAEADLELTRLNGTDKTYLADKKTLSAAAKNAKQTADAKNLDAANLSRNLPAPAIAAQVKASIENLVNARAQLQAEIAALPVTIERLALADVKKHCAHLQQFGVQAHQNIAHLNGEIQRNNGQIAKLEKQIEETKVDKPALSDAYRAESVALKAWNGALQDAIKLETNFVSRINNELLTATNPPHKVDHKLSKTLQTQRETEIGKVDNAKKNAEIAAKRVDDILRPKPPDVDVKKPWEAQKAAFTAHAEAMAVHEKIPAGTKREYVEQMVENYRLLHEENQYFNMKDHIDKEKRRIQRELGGGLDALTDAPLISALKKEMKAQEAVDRAHQQLKAHGGKRRRAGLIKLEILKGNAFDPAFAGSEQERRLQGELERLNMEVANDEARVGKGVADARNAAGEAHNATEAAWADRDF